MQCLTWANEVKLGLVEKNKRNNIHRSPGVLKKKKHTSPLAHSAPQPTRSLTSAASSTSSVPPRNSARGRAHGVSDTDSFARSANRRQYKKAWSPKFRASNLAVPPVLDIAAPKLSISSFCRLHRNTATPKQWFLRSSPTQPSDRPPPPCLLNAVEIGAASGILENDRCRRLGNSSPGKEHRSPS